MTFLVQIYLVEEFSFWKNTNMKLMLQKIWNRFCDPFSEGVWMAYFFQNMAEILLEILRSCDPDKIVL